MSDYKEQLMRLDKYDYNIIFILTDNETKVNKKYDINHKHNKHNTSFSYITRSLEKKTIYIIYDSVQIKKDRDFALNDILYGINQSCAFILSDNKIAITTKLDDCIVMSDEFHELISTIHFNCYNFLKEYMQN